MSVWRTFTLENATTEIDSKALTWCCVELFQTVLIIVNNLSGDSFQNLNCTGVYSVTVKYVKIKKKIQGFMTQNDPLHISNINSAALFEKGNQSNSTMNNAVRFTEHSFDR